LLGLPNYLLTVAGYVAQTFAMGAFAFWGPTFLLRLHGMKLEAAGTFFGGALVVTGLSATLLGGWAATAWQKRHPSGYAWTMALSSAASAPAAAAAFLVHDLVLAQVFLATAMFFIFLPTGPINTLILETVPVTMRASAMAASIFAIHLFGDLFSPQIVGLISDHFGGLRRGVMILPFALGLSAALWGWLALRTKPERKVA
jgi:sugar phosphate permease